MSRLWLWSSLTDFKMIIGFYVLAVFLQCSFSLWKIFVLRLKCVFPVAMPIKPTLCLKLSNCGEEKKKKRGKPSCNSGPCGTQCCRAHVQAAYEESDLSFNGNTARKPNKGWMSWSMRPWWVMLGQANVTHFLKARCFGGYWRPFCCLRGVFCRHAMKIEEI